MPTLTRTALEFTGEPYLARVLRALGWERWAVVALMPFFAEVLPKPLVQGDIARGLASALQRATTA